jgi:hypothetical protein
MKRISLWLEHTRFNSIALSGGADSRMIFSALIHNKPSKKILIYSRLHPDLNEKQDADVLISKNICFQLGFEHRVQKATEMPSAYLSQEAPALAPIFSGLYGGEYLGGEITQLLAENSLYLDKTNGLLENAIKLLAQSFTCDIYDGAWSPIYSHHNLTLTPFWDSSILQLLFNLPSEKVQKYKLYNNLFDFLPEPLLSEPLQSQLTDYYPLRSQATLPLINPKSLVSLKRPIHSAIYDFLPAKVNVKSIGFEKRLTVFQSLLHQFKELN